MDWSAALAVALPHLDAGPLAGKRRRETFEHGGRTVRYGTHGSLRVTLDGPEGGTWRDHEADRGGGVVDLVEHLSACDRDAAVAWLRDCGALPARGPQARPGRPGAGANAPGAPQPRPGPEPASPASLDGTSDRLAHARRLMAASEPIPRDPQHPARRWLAARHLWRPDVPVPPWLRWIDAAAIHPDHCGAGALAVPVAPLATWAAAAPEWPRAAWTGVQLVHVAADGAPALDRPEGTAGLGRPALARDLAALGCPVTLAPDADAAGLTAYCALKAALEADGGAVRQLALADGDPAAAARPFPAVDRRVVAAFRLMHATGAGVHPVRPEWEARRLAAMDAAALGA